MSKKRYIVEYTETVKSTIAVLAETEDEAYSLAEDAWCDYDDREWTAVANVTGVQILQVFR